MGFPVVPLHAVAFTPRLLAVLLVLGFVQLRLPQHLLQLAVADARLAVQRHAGLLVAALVPGRDRQHAAGVQREGGGDVHGPLGQRGHAQGEVAQHVVVLPLGALALAHLAEQSTAA